MTSTSHQVSISLAERIAEAFGWKTGLVPRTDMPAVRIGERWVALPHLSYGQWPPRMEEETVLKPYLTKGVIWRGVGQLASYKTASWLSLHDFEPDARLNKKLKRIGNNDFKALNGGVELLEDFWLVYARRLHELGSFPLPKEFFKALLKGFSEGYAELFVLYNSNGPIGGACNLCVEGFYENAWFATLKNYQQVGASYFLHQHMIKHACQLGMNIYSFGRSTTGSGVHRFKKQWGCQDVPLAWYKDGKHIEGRWPMPATLLIKQMPFGMVCRLGGLVAKYIY